MSKKPQYDPEEIRYPNQKIVESPLVPEMEKSYIEYAMSVIVGPVSYTHLSRLSTSTVETRTSTSWAFPPRTIRSCPLWKMSTR